MPWIIMIKVLAWPRHWDGADAYAGYEGEVIELDLYDTYNIPVSPYSTVKERGWITLKGKTSILCGGGLKSFEFLPY